jgi:hypothetical protein
VQAAAITQLFTELIVKDMFNVLSGSLFQSLIGIFFADIG